MVIGYIHYRFYSICNHFEDHLLGYLNYDSMLEGEVAILKTFTCDFINMFVRYQYHFGKIKIVDKITQSKLFILERKG